MTDKLADLLALADENKKRCIHMLFVFFIFVFDLMLKDIELQKTLHFKSILDWFRIRLGYTSNALEGNSFSENDVYLLIIEGIRVEYCFAKLNYWQVLRYVANQ